MLLRLTTTALCAAGVLLLATLPPLRLEIVRPADPPDPSDPRGPAAGRAARVALRQGAEALSVVDVAQQLAPADLASLVSLKPGERITAVNDQPLEDDLAVSDAILSRGLHAGAYLDLTVSSADAATERRVLVLLH